ncbi:hypothetical protein [Immundisolibacter sp.]|jgi:hypothetical protein
MSDIDLLPGEFHDLEHWAARWALPTEAARNRMRVTSEYHQIEAFYHALLPRMGAVLDYLQKFPTDALPTSAQHLMYLGCAFMEVAPAVELFKEPRVTDGFAPERFEILL